MRIFNLIRLIYFNLLWHDDIILIYNMTYHGYNMINKNLVLEVH
jgi:hypothetical protein